MRSRGWISDEMAGVLFIVFVVTPLWTAWRAWRWLRTGR
jgi:hypothetical protein